VVPGTLAPGVSQSWVWNDASSTRSYQAGLSPVGATTSASCKFEVTRSYYAQQPSGELEFRFTIKNIGTISSAANILLASAANSSVGFTGVLDPGESLNATWNSAVFGDAHLVAFVPAGATRAADCRFEVVGESYIWVYELEFRFTVENDRYDRLPGEHPQHLPRIQQRGDQQHVGAGQLDHDPLEQRRSIEPGLGSCLHAAIGLLPLRGDPDLLLAATELRQPGVMITALCRP